MKEAGDVRSIDNICILFPWTVCLWVKCLSGFCAFPFLSFSFSVCSFSFQCSIHVKLHVNFHILLLMKLAWLGCQW